MKKNQYLKFWIPILGFLLVCGIYLCFSLGKTNGEYIYFIDDAYIHMAMAKNLAWHNVWGITCYHFSSTSSSPLYTIMLALLIKIVGNHSTIPLIFNLIVTQISIIIVVKYFSLFVKNNTSVILFTSATLGVCLLHFLALSGMEHSLHVLLIILSVYCSTLYENKKRYKILFWLSILLLGLARFESMFYFSALLMVFFIQKKIKKAILLLIFGFVPIVIFCYYNHSNSGYYFPNSVVLKGTTFTLDKNIITNIALLLKEKILFNRSFYKIAIIPLVVSILLFLESKNISLKEKIEKNFWNMVFFIVMIEHSLFAELRFLRYEAYILVGYCMAVLPRIKSKMWVEKKYSILVGIATVITIYKIQIVHKILWNGGKNIYEQQVANAKFVNKNYNTAKIVANDIGALCYFTDIQLLDIAGLASVEMIPFNKNKKKFDNSFKVYIDKYTKNNQYDMAIVYESWMGGQIPKDWEKVAVLKIKEKISVDEEEVTYYCINKSIKNELIRKIKQYPWNKNIEVKLYKK